MLLTKKNMCYKIILCLMITVMECSDNLRLLKHIYSTLQSVVTYYFHSVMGENFKLHR